ncbi:DUF5926 family protein [Allobranchiibius sp. GilTou38]|uniref:DUF5926 family protein n=1 Tax=Allobranchiibius sp. GilTou38 TaxID=2815210 RepID=UPI001AA14C09|nr:DUF5926 family protein [Allobranchiibius sp. GilTou38]MBO1765491.1 topoisomerase II [Allobranchiibius sp. GilTou38]
MGKASRRKGERTRQPIDPTQQSPAFVRRPYEGLPGEAGWVAMREIVPAATASVTFTLDGAPREATVASVLPLAWPGLHRADGTLFVALQTGGASSDPSRDVAQTLLATAALEPGEPLTAAPRTTAGGPRLQDLLTNTDFIVQLHDGFDFWVEGQELDAEGAASLQRANEAITPTVALSSAEHAYWCRIGARTYVRWVLPHEEDKATDALARLHAAGSSSLDEGRLLGAFRAHGLLVPVWEVDADAEPASFDDAFGALAARFDDAVGIDTPLTVEERRARSGISSRQITLR